MVKVDSKEVSYGVWGVRMRHSGGKDVIIVNESRTSCTCVNGRDVRGNHLAVAGAFAVTLRQASIGKMYIVSVVRETRCVASFGNVGPVEGNGREAFRDVTFSKRYVGRELKEIFCFGELKRCLRGEWSDRSEVVNDPVFFETFCIFNLPSVKGLADVFIVNIDGNASFNLFVEGIRLDVLEFRRREAG